MLAVLYLIFNEGYTASTGEALIDRPEVAGPLAEYRWLHAARADLLRRLARFGEAGEAYRGALDLAENGAERAYLTRRVLEVSTSARSSSGWP